MDARVKPGHDERKTQENVGSETPTDAIRILPGLTDPAAPGSARRTSIGVPPRFSPQGVFHRKGLSLRPGFLGRGGTRFAYPLSGCYPPLPVQFSPARTAHPSRSARGMMPKAARARVASPPAGTALAPHDGLPAAARPNHWAR